MKELRRTKRPNALTEPFDAHMVYQPIPLVVVRARVLRSPDPEKHDVNDWESRTDVAAVAAAPMETGAATVSNPVASYFDLSRSDLVIVQNLP